MSKYQHKAECLDRFYGGKSTALGYLTLADFYVTELSYYIEKLVPSYYETQPVWRRCREGLEAVPQIRAYYESEGAVKGPFTETYTPVQI